VDDRLSRIANAATAGVAGRPDQGTETNPTRRIIIYFALFAHLNQGGFINKMPQ